MKCFMSTETMIFCDHPMTFQIAESSQYGNPAHTNSRWIVCLPEQSGHGSETTYWFALDPKRTFWNFQWSKIFDIVANFLHNSGQSWDEFIYRVPVVILACGFKPVANVGEFRSPD